MKKIFILMICISLILGTPTLVSNAESDIGKTSKYIHYYVMYWINHFKIESLINPITNKKLTREEIELLVNNIVKHESRFKVKSKSWEKTVGCYSYGLMRLLPSTAKDIGWRFKNEEELYDIDKNIKYGIKYFCLQIKRWGGNTKKAVASYNAGGCYYQANGKYINQYYVNMVYYGECASEKIKTMVD